MPTCHRQSGWPGCRAVRLLLAATAFSWASASIATIPPAGATATTPGGPVIIDGTDAGYHGQVDPSHLSQGTWRYPALAFQQLMNQATAGTPNTMAVLGAADSTLTGEGPNLGPGDCGAMAHWGAIADGYTATYYRTADDINSFFAQLRAGTATPRIVYVADTNCANGLAVDAQNNSIADVPSGDDALTANAISVANFVNGGGGLLTQYSQYGWLASLLPNITTSSANGQAPQLTPAGQLMFPTLTDADIAGEYHQGFSGTFAPLQALAGEGPTTMMLGGSHVQLPTIATSTTTAKVPLGSSATVTTTIEDQSGVPVQGVSVTFTITAGPNANQTQTSLTDGIGAAVWTYPGTSTGTDTITSTATVNATPYAGRATVNWDLFSPSAPTVTSVVQTGTTATVTFTPSAFDGGDPSIAYATTAFPLAGPGCRRRTAAGPSPVTLSGLVGGCLYTVSVSAQNGGGRIVSDFWADAVAAGPYSLYSLPQQTTPPTPNGDLATPYNTTLTVAGGFGPYTWSIVTGVLPGGLTLSPGGTITGTPTAPGSFTFTAEVSDRYQFYPADQTYTIYVTPTPAAAPQAPVVTVTPRDTHLIVSWPANPAGDNVTGYEYSLDGGFIWHPVTATLAGGVETDSITGLTNGTTYRVVVRADSAAGQTPSPTVNGTPWPPPRAPIVTVTPGDTQLTVSWPANPAGDHVTGYDYSLDGGVSWTPATPTMAGGNETDTVAGLTNGTTYDVVVRADNTSGQTASTPVPGTPRSGGPPPPGPATTGGSVAATPNGAGYWALAPDGTISAHGDAQNLGSENGVRLNAPVVAVSSTSTGNGYWLAASDGGVFTFGDAKYYGSMGGTKLNQPIVGMARTPDNLGYWLIAADGGVFTFGDANYYGSTGAIKLNKPIAAVTATGDGHGYWLAATDGGVFTFGDANFFGSMGALNLNKHVLGIAATPSGNGYWLVAGDGGVFTFGDARYYGSLGGTGTVPIIGMIANADNGYRLIDPSGNAYGFGTNA